jgi:hypothetical protein
MTMGLRLALAMVVMLGLLAPESAAAKQGFGEEVDAYCSALGRGTPYASLAGKGFLSECSLCHKFTYPPTLPDKGNKFDPPAAAYLAGRSSGDFSWFCPGVVNQLPAITPIADRNVNAGQMLVIDVFASDADGDPLTLSAASAPAGASFVDHRNGTATFTWTPGVGDVGSRTVNFLAQDDAVPPGQAMEPVGITVGSSNRAPVLGAIGNRTVDPGVLLEIAVTASDLDGGALQLSAAPLPTGSTFSDAGNGTGLFAWTPSAGQLGNSALTFQVKDAGVPQASDTELVTISVGSVNAPPVLEPIGSRSVQVGEPLSIAISATDPDGDLLQFAAQGLPAGALLDDAGDGTATLDWMPGAADMGVYALTLSVGDDGTPPESDSESLTLTVPAESVPSDVRVDAARWSGQGEDEYLELRVRGSGAAPSEMVGLLDADTGLVLASKKAGRHGAFRFKLEPMIPPCAVQVQAGDVRSEPFPVGGAPADCGRQMLLGVRAKWKCEDEGSLRVKGKRAPVGATVEVHDAATAALLGTAQVDERGLFRLRIPASTAPSAIDLSVSAGELAWTVEAVPVQLDTCSDDEEVRAR